MVRLRWLVCGPVLAALVLGLAACSSSSKHEAKHRALIAAKEYELPPVPRDVLKMGIFNKYLHVRNLAMVHSGNRAAVVIQLFDVKRLQGNLPVLIHVTGPNRELIYSNGGAGLEPALQHIGLARRGQTVWWVDDRLSAELPAQGFNVRVGTGTRPEPSSVPDVVATGVQFDDRAGSVTGTLVNRSANAPREVLIAAVVLNKFGIAAAGRVVVHSLGPSPASAPFDISLIGKPQGGRLELSVMPTLR